MARRACIKNIRSITDVGGAPYKILRPILQKVENPEQLRQIETASPQICGQDAELWLQFMERDVPNYKENPYEPADPQKWYKCYKKLVKESKNEIDKDAALLKATIDGINNEKAKHRLKRVDLGFVKLPKGVQRDAPIIHLPNRIQFTDRGAQHGPFPSQRQLKGNRGEVGSNAPRRIIEPKGKLDQLRRAAKATNHFQHQQPKKPTGKITAREMALKSKPTASSIVTAPRGLVEEHLAASVPKPIDPTSRTAPSIASRKRRTEHDGDEQPRTSTTEEREKRLKAFTCPSSAPKTAPTIRPPRSQTSTTATSSPAPIPPSVASKPPIVAGSAFGQIGNRNIEALNNQKIQDAANRKLRVDEERKSELIRIGPREGNPQPSEKKAALGTLQSQINPGLFSASKASVPEVTAPNEGLPRVSTSSPSNKGTGPPMMKKKRAHADVFMPPNKKLRRS